MHSAARTDPVVRYAVLLGLYGEEDARVRDAAIACSADPGEWARATEATVLYRTLRGGFAWQVRGHYAWQDGLSGPDGLLASFAEGADPAGAEREAKGFARRVTDHGGLALVTREHLEG